MDVKVDEQLGFGKGGPHHASLHCSSALLSYSYPIYRNASNWAPGDGTSRKLVGENFPTKLPFFSFFTLKISEPAHLKIQIFNICLSKSPHFLPLHNGNNKKEEDEGRRKKEEHLPITISPDIQR